MMKTTQSSEWDEEYLRHLPLGFRALPKDIAQRMVDDGAIVRMFRHPVTEEALWATIRILAAKVRELSANDTNRGEEENIVLDNSWNGLPRLTCTVCFRQSLRQPYMSDSQWESETKSFGRVHRDCNESSPPSNTGQGED